MFLTEDEVLMIKTLIKISVRGL